MVTFHATFHTETSFQVGFSTDSTFAVGMGSVIMVPIADYYDGDYNVTPGTEDQVLRTSGLAMTNDVTVEAIPQNYGLITYNGAVLTVS